MRRILARALRCYAGTIERDWPGPHVAGTLGATWSRLAANLRTLAAQLAP
jgi:hypothetical protein